MFKQINNGTIVLQKYETLWIKRIQKRKIKVGRKKDLITLL